MTGARPTADLSAASADRLWMADAACRKHDPDWWFPEPNERAEAAEAKRICRRCPVQKRCGQYAEEIGALYGIFAGQRRNSMALPPRDGPSCGTAIGYSVHRARNEKACDSCRQAMTEDARRRRAEGRHK